ncbi:MAG: hypothetical protein JNK48_15025, partial [Bryobacterales bacterium]|nr:hypothetical protein [Bryobacterales bacterium]
LMLHAPDGWLALGMSGQLLLLAGCEFRLSRMGSGRQAFWLVAAFLTIGAKEAGYVFQGLLAAFLLLREPGAWLRLTPHAALLALWTWRLQAASGRASGFVVGEFLGRLGAHAELMLPATPWGLADLVLCGLAMYSAVIGWRRRRELSGQLIFFCWLTSVAMLGFVSAPKAIALRYVIPPVYLAAVPLGLALQQIPRGRAVVPGAFLALFPILMAGGIYRQELGYREYLDQTAELLRRMEGKARQGYVLAVSEAATDIDGEPLASIEAYFARYGQQWYGLPQKRELHHVRQQGWPAGRFAMASYLSPERVVKETGIDARRVQHVEALQAGDAGVLGKLTGRFLYLDRVLGRSGPYRTDTGAPEPATEPRFYLYTVGATPQDAGWTQEAVPVSRPPGAF